MNSPGEARVTTSESRVAGAVVVRIGLVAKAPISIWIQSGAPLTVKVTVPEHASVKGVGAGALAEAVAKPETLAAPPAPTESVNVPADKETFCDTGAKLLRTYFVRDGLAREEITLCNEVSVDLRAGDPGRNCRQVVGK